MNSESTRSYLHRRWESELVLLRESAHKSEGVTVHDRVEGEASVVIERRTTITVDEEVQVQTGVAHFTLIRSPRWPSQPVLVVCSGVLTLAGLRPLYHPNVLPVTGVTCVYDPWDFRLSLYDCVSRAVELITWHLWATDMNGALNREACQWADDPRNRPLFPTDGRLLAPPQGVAR